jgi:hypothetical protein
VYRVPLARRELVLDGLRSTLQGDDMLKYTPGDRVAHAQYGDGTVNSMNEYHTVIDFDAHGVRTFSSPRVVLSASSTPAPVKPAKATRRTKRPSVKTPAS